MRSILTLVRKDFINFFRNKAAVSLTFAVPFVLIWVFGTVFGVNRTEGGPRDIPLAVVNASSDPAADHLIEALGKEKAFKIESTRKSSDGATRALLEDDLEPLMRANAFRFALVIPADLFSEETLGLRLKIYTNPRNEIETQLVNGILQKVIFSNVPQLLGQAALARGQGYLGAERLDQFNQSIAENVARTFGGNATEIHDRIGQGNFSGLMGRGSGKEAADLLGELIHVETIQVAGREMKSPAATRIVGGWAMQFLLFALSGAATALFYERDHGIFQRILAGPVGRAQILWSKFIYGVSIGLLQLVVLFVAGRILYGIDIENHIGLLLVMCVFAASACTSFGMLLASITTTHEAASGLATFVILLMCAVGGAWFPVTLMPEFVQQFSKLTLVYWAMEGFTQVLWAGASFYEVLPILGILGGMTAVVMTFAVWRFNRGQLFG